MPIRLLLMNLQGLFLMLISMLVTIGHDFDKGPLPPGCRKSFLNWFYRFMAKIWVFLAGFCCTSIVDVDADYSEYLGPDYKEKYDKSLKMTGTMISNHVTNHDAMIITQFLNNSFACDVSFRSIPLMGKLAQMADAIFVPRAGSDEAR